ncbi:MAG TPA: orotidine-5'-phosphate decarboxylase [Pyrinomonadaceae bacterium]|nr:orotidine-5'-phosphate decarboxylase [Pyrinomonadaceae bacterium]
MFEVSKATEKTTQVKEKIIVALDVETAREAREIIAELREEVGAFKIGLQLFTSAGASFVREAVASDIKVFLDVKFHDIPNTVAKASVEVARLGVWMFNIHAVGGGEMIQKTVEEVKGFCEKENLTQPKIIGVTVLTSSNRETLRETGIEKGTGEQVVSLARLSAKYGLDGVVASPREVKLIRENVESKDFLIVTPGIRSSKFKVQSSKMEDQKPKVQSQFETYEDQRRVMTANEAVRSGSDYLVIGRPILQAKDKILAVRDIIKEIETT